MHFIYSSVGVEQRRSIDSLTKDTAADGIPIAVNPTTVITREFALVRIE